MIQKKVFRNALVASAFAVAAGSFGFSNSEAYANTLAAALGEPATDSANVFPAVSSTATYAPSVMMGSGHVAGQGWQANETGSLSLGVEGSALEAFKLQLGYANTSANELFLSGNVVYRVDTGDGWGDWISDGSEAGTTGQSGSIYAVEIALEGNVSQVYDVRYRVYATGLGWLGWAENGDAAGTASFGRAIEKLEIELVERDAVATDANAYLALPTLELATTADGSTWTPAENGLVAEGSALAGLSVALSGDDVPAGSVSASALVDGAWTELSRDGSQTAPGAFTQVAFALEGDAANWLDIEYRAYVSGLGWLGWTSNGQAAGASSYDGAIEAVEVRLVPKGDAASGSDALYDAEIAARSAALVAAAKATPTTGSGFCARWVSNVYQAAGLARPNGNANDMYWNYCTSSDRSELEPGMIVATPSHTWTSSGRIYGHVGIYIGDGLVMDSLNYVRTMTLDQFIEDYSMLYEVKWGWAL